ncbi:zinc metallopeptidase [Parendozoicomonas sp. Alg238-R29]|uniref:zinc metallopeptidase n=1 Tax=Parendozoicomonas sp. Alg238-R29 TaxID=2993446 RepID=UPI00248DADB3|nr:zinc metallopeptidase [Parendozoicomonas sp. Alg238-R29]
MVLAIPALLILALVFGPQLWIRYVLKRHGRHRADLQGTGGELAEHLIRRFELDAKVRMGTSGEDYYDPEERIVSLSPEHYEGQSITAVAVATHEVGHALQHKEQHPGFMRRQRRIRTAMVIERFSAIALMISPAVFLLTRVPQSTALTIVIGAIGMLAVVWVQVLNLPVENDASFNKAMPILEEGYLMISDQPAARQVLKAAALTYVAAALASLLNLGRWIAILRR